MKRFEAERAIRGVIAAFQHIAVVAGGQRAAREPARTGPGLARHVVHPMTAGEAMRAQADAGPQGPERTADAPLFRPVAGEVAACVARGRYKRPFDLLAVGLGLALLGPVWLLVGVGIAAAIRLEDGGPALYRQLRCGRGGKTFRIIKFRTMMESAEAGTGPVLALPRDGRVTRVGRVLRRFHLDELPQVVNVLRGEMSLVGPRPERPELVARIELAVPGFSERLRVRPGIAGLAQAVGAYNWEPWRKLHYDKLYIATMNPWLDVSLCVRCVAKVLAPRRRRRAVDPAAG